jgi:WD40 repeat protein
VARGGLGRIVLAFDRRLGRRVALKELLSRDPKAERRFVREAKITARLEHPNIVPIHEAGRWPSGDRFYAMKLVEGRTLSAALAGAETREERLALLPHLIDVADAIAYAHSQGILHRDIKPANVMVGAFGETMVIDWGLAKILGEKGEEEGLEVDHVPISATETSDGIVVGTPPYMAPEQARADSLDERSDVYALGALLYQILSGRRPYEDVDPKDVLREVVRGPPVPIDGLAPEMPRDLLAVVKKAMHRHPAHRYPSAQEMAEELRRFSTGQLVGAHRYSPLEHAWRFVRRHAAAVGVALLLLSVLIGFAGWSFRGLADRSRIALQAQEDAEARERELDLEKARSLLARDPTEAVAWLKRVRPPIRGAATVAAEAEEAGVARAVLEGHVQEVEHVRADPGGRFVASASRDGAVILWSIATGAAERIEHGARVSALAFSEDGAHLASGAYDGTVRVVRPSAPERRRATPPARGHQAPVVAIGFAPSGDRLVSLGRDRRLILWTLDGRRAEVIETPPVGDWADLAFVDEGRTVVTGGHGSRAMVWDLDTGEGRPLADLGSDITAFSARAGAIALGARDGSLAVVDPDREMVRTLGAHDTEVRALAFSPGGRRLASAGFDGAVMLWPLGTEQSPEPLDGHDERVTSLAFSPGGRWLASGSWDGTVRLRDLTKGTETQTLRGHAQVVTDLAFGPRGDFLFSSSWDTAVRVWPVRARGGALLEGHQIGVHAVDFAPDGRRLVSGGHDDALRVWDLAAGEDRVLSGHEDNVYRVRYSPDGRWIASSSDDRTVRLWPAGGGAPRVLRGHRGDVEELAFSADGRWLASAGRAGDLFLWPVEEDGPGRSLLGHRGAVTGVGFGADGRLASAGRDGQVLLWPLGPGAPRRLLVDAGTVEGLDVAPDGRRLAAVGGRGELWVWSLPEGRLLLHVETDLDEPAAVRLSPDGRLAAVASAQVGLWLCNVAYGVCHDLRGHAARVFDLEFSPSGRALATGSGDHTARVWDVETLESRVLRGHRAPVFDVAFSPDGSFVASGSGDTDVRVWPAELPPRRDQLPRFLEELTTYQVD